MAEMKKYLVVGTPITQSLSPKLHNTTYGELGLNRELNPIDPGNRTGFDALIADLRAGKHEGFCVTIPWKLAAAQACDTLSDTAQQSGAANYIRRESDGSLSGDNTDAMGFANACKQELNFDFAGSTVAVCGSGGASRAIVAACLAEGAARVDLITRSPGDVSDFPPQVTTLSYDELYALGTTYDLLVNATPLGMNDDSSMPVSIDFLTNKVKAVYDAVYRKEGTTPLVAAACKTSIPAADGRSMLIEQAILGMQFWGLSEDSTTLRSAINESLGR